MAHHITQDLIQLKIAVLTVSDTRNIITDSSGEVLIDSLKAEGHELVERRIVSDDIYKIRAVLSQWIADEETQVVLITGGTGFTSRDSTPEAITPLLEKIIEGYGEIFRSVSVSQIGTSTLQSRAIAGLTNNTLVFSMPGSNNACKTAWDKVIKEQLDASHRPCNFVPHLNIQAEQCETRS